MSVCIFFLNSSFAMLACNDLQQLAMADFIIKYPKHSKAYVILYIISKINDLSCSIIYKSTPSFPFTLSI